LAVVAGHVEITLDVGQIRAKRLNGDEAIMAAFEENARDLSRVGGN